jgi:hypothetical protein
MRIYLAGPYRSDGILDIARNIRRARARAAALLAQGHEVYCPHLDWELTQADSAFADRLTVEDFQRNSMSFLTDWAECVQLLPGWEASEGTLREIAEAMQRCIPVMTGSHALPPTAYERAVAGLAADRMREPAIPPEADD